MKTREWILIILLLSIVQAFIWYVSFVNSSNISALGYVSFAGTIISIILAVVAIIYNFTESVGQKNKSDLISIQIEKLRDVVSNIDLKSDSLDIISEISSELSTFKDSFDKRICETNERILSLQDNGIFINKQEIVAEFDKTKLTEALVKNSSPLYEISLLMICSLNKTLINSDEDRINDFRKIVNKPVDMAFKKFNKDDKLRKEIYHEASNIFMGSVLSIYVILFDLGLIIENEKNEYEITIELFSMIDGFKNCWSDSSQYYEEIRNNIAIKR